MVPSTPRDMLRHELDFRRRILTYREFFIVLNELQLHAYRDPLVTAPLRQIYAQWRQYLTELIHQGVASRQFRAGVPVAALVEVISGSFGGLH